MMSAQKPRCQGLPGSTSRATSAAVSGVFGVGSGEVASEGPESGVSMDDGGKIVPQIVAATSHKPLTTVTLDLSTDCVIARP